jgi:heptosyltransferase-1
MINSPPESVLVVRLGAMGDVIHTLSVICALRSSSPGIRIGWIVEARWADLLFARNTPRSGSRTPNRPIPDFVHVVDTKRWRKSPISPTTRRDVMAVLGEVRNQHYAIAADFQGALKSAFIARFCGAQTVIGFQHPRETLARIFYQHRVATKRTHVIEHYRALAEFIAGTELAICDPVFPRDEQAQADITSKLAVLGENFVLMNPGAGWGAKQWPAERYGEVARALAQIGLTTLINFTPPEQELARRVQEASEGVAHPISCSISELIALTRRARLFIGGDTGPLHLAAALRVPVVAIFGPTDPARNGPYATRSVILRSPVSKTSLSHTSTPDPGLLSITSMDVITAARQLLENTGV